LKKILLKAKREAIENTPQLVNNISNNTFYKLYQDHFSELLFIAFNLIGNEQEAEDVVSGLFEKLMANAGKNQDVFFEETDFEILGYLKISIRNACFDILKARKRRAGILFRIGNSLQFWKKPEIYSKFQKDAFEMMMTELSAREKEIFEMHLEGFKNFEIAQRLNLSELTVRNTLHNAKKRIRKMWNIFMR
jgi:RNA polymerase sigma-70 factor (ECF subfamily)